MEPSLISDHKSETDSLLSVFCSSFAQADKESNGKHGVAIKRDSTGKLWRDLPIN